MKLDATPSILVVDDEVDLAQVLRDNLLRDGYRAEIAYDGDRALEALDAHDFDLLILDVMLPGRDGFSICETVRRGGSAVPILFLTAHGGSEARIRGLEAGGDDYLEKPFSLRELMLRVEALLRRQPAGKISPVIRFGANRVDLASGEARSWDGVQRQLSGSELGVLRSLVDHENEEVTADRILEEVWRNDVIPSSRMVRHLVQRLAAVFEPDTSEPRHFHVRPGQNYVFVRDSESDPDGPSDRT